MLEANSAISKPKLTAAQQVESMKRNGISFDLFPEERAEEFLARRNYFFKLKAFAKNFDKWRLTENAPDQYVNLDFAYLVELSKLDMRLRSFVLGASLDIEHFLKVRINEAVMVDPKCDGYQIVSDFLRHSEAGKVSTLEKRLDASSAREAASSIANIVRRVLHELDDTKSRETVPESVIRAFDDLREVADNVTEGVDLHHIEKSISRLGASSYSRSVANKYGKSNRMAVWNLMELASFGDVISLYKFYFIESAEQKDPTAQVVKPLLFPAKTLRNAAAHNSCLMHGMRDKLSKPVGAIAKSLRDEYGYDAWLVANTRRVPVIHDLSALLICYDRVVEGPGIRRDRACDMRALRIRLMRHREYFSKQFEIATALDFIAALLEGFADTLDRQAPLA